MDLKLNFPERSNAHKTRDFSIYVHKTRDCVHKTRDFDL